MVNFNMFSILINCLVLFLIKFSAHNCFSFTIDELKSINYEVDILQTPVKKGEEQASPVVHMTSIFGQEYQCLLPQIQDEDATEKVTHNEKSTDIKELLRPLHTGNCLLKAKDWWTYELCFGQYIKQFHIEDGQITGQIITLGLYDYDYDWSNETDEDKFKHTKQKFHSQYYVNGTKCDLTGQPRVAEVRIFCEEDSGDYIHRVDEPGTCSYVIAVHTSRVCSHPQLKPLPSKKMYPIPCHPLLSDEQYSHYLEKLSEEKILADQKRSQWLNNQQERLQEMKNENVVKSPEVKDNAESKDQVQNTEEVKKNDFDLDEVTITKLQEFENLESIIAANKYSVIKGNLKEMIENLMKEEDENELTPEQSKYLKILKEAENRVKHATSNLKKAESLVQKSETPLNNDKEEPLIIKEDLMNNEESDEDEKDAKLDPSDKNKEDEEEKESSDNDDLQVRIRRLDRLHSSGKMYEIDQVQQKKLEKAIREKLERYGVSTGGRRIEVKIIKAGYYDNHLTDEEASQFENMITALLTGEQEAIQEMERNKKLEENYKFTWQIDNEDEEEE